MRFCPLFLALLGACLVGTLHAQPTEPQQTDGTIQLGLGLLPGLGAQVGYIAPGQFFSLEGMLYVDGSPQFAGGEGNVQVALGAGGAIRTLGVARLFSEESFAGYDIDIGLRLGPALFFTVDETRADKNRRFSLFLEPYMRFVTRASERFVLFAEGGAQKPLLRAGVWVGL